MNDGPGRPAPRTMSDEELKKALESRPSTADMSEMKPLIVQDNDEPQSRHDFVVGRTPKWEDFTPEEARALRKARGLPVDE